MSNFMKEIECLLASEAFQVLLTSKAIRINQLNAVIAILIKACIPFDVIFEPGTRREATSAVLTIYINPTTDISFTLLFEPGPPTL